MFVKEAMPVVADKGKAKEAFRKSPSDVKN